MADIFIPEDLARTDEEERFSDWLKTREQERPEIYGNPFTAPIPSAPTPPSGMPSDAPGATLTLDTRLASVPVPTGDADLGIGLPAASPGPPPITPRQEEYLARPQGRVEAPNQFAMGLSAEDAYAACGPAAALAFAQAHGGRMPTAAEALDLAKQAGWTRQGGMNVPQNQKKLLDSLGIPSVLELRVDWNKIKQDVTRGNPVTISTPMHYFVASDYDPQTGKYYFGNTGTALREGSKWMSPEEVARISPPQAVLYLDNPNSPGPSVAFESPQAGKIGTSVVKNAAAKYGVDPDIFARQIYQESKYDVNAGSPAGARGVAQFMPGTAEGVARQMGVSVQQFWASPELQLEGAALHMADLLKQYKGDYRLALAAYNAGPGNVQKYGGVPPFKETQTYLANILEGKGFQLPQGAGNPVESVRQAVGGTVNQAVGAVGEALGGITGQPDLQSYLREVDTRINKAMETLPGYTAQNLPNALGKYKDALRPEVAPGLILPVGMGTLGSATGQVLSDISSGVRQAIENIIPGVREYSEQSKGILPGPLGELSIMDWIEGLVLDPTNLIPGGQASHAVPVAAAALGMIPMKSVDDFGKAFTKLVAIGDEVPPGVTKIPGLSGPNPEVLDVAKEYMAEFGLPMRPFTGALLDPEQSRRIADLYDKAESNPNDPAVIAAYQKFIQETRDQFEVMTKHVDVEPWLSEGQPYKNSAEMRADVQNNHHLFYFKTDETQRHPFMTDEENDMFRAVHDYFAHASHGAEFGPAGEENAWLAHALMYSDEARTVMTTETRGQNSWVNFGPHSDLPVTERPYAEQKSFQMPDDYVFGEGALGKTKTLEEVKKLTPAERRSMASEMVSKLHEEQGFSYSIHYGDMAGADGWAVSRRDKGLKKAGQIDDVKLTETIQNFIRSRADVLADPNAVVGGWIDGDKLYLDVSRLVPDEETARLMGAENAQYAIYHLGEKRQVDIWPGTEADATRILSENPEVASAYAAVTRITPFLEQMRQVDLGDGSVERLSKIRWAPGPDKAKGQKGTPVAIDTLVEQAKLFESAKDWYPEFAKLIADKVGKKLAQEAMVMVGITSWGTKPEDNFRDALGLMAFARKFKAEGGGSRQDFLDGAKEFKRAAGQGPMGKELTYSGDMVSAAYQVYNKGWYTASSQKAWTFTKNLLGAVWDVYESPMVFDRWMGRALGFDDAKEAMKDPKSIAYGQRVIEEVADRLGWRYDQAQSAVWYAVRTRANDPQVNQLVRQGMDREEALRVVADLGGTKSGTAAATENYMADTLAMLQEQLQRSDINWAEIGDKTGPRLGYKAPDQDKTKFFAGAPIGAAGGAAAGDEDLSPEDRAKNMAIGAFLGAVVPGRKLVGKLAQNAPKGGYTDDMIQNVALEVEKIHGSGAASTFIDNMDQLRASGATDYALDHFARNAVAKGKGSAEEWFKALRYNSMLSAPGSIQIQALGNMIELPYKLLRDSARHVAQPEVLMSEAHGIASGFKQGLWAAMATLEHGSRTGGGIESTTRLSDLPGASGAIGKVLEAPGRGFAAIDELFMTITQGAELGRLAAVKATQEGKKGQAWAARVTELMEGKEPDLVQEAHGAAERLVFKGEMGKIGNALKGVQDVPYFGNLIFPFLRTVYHITSRGLDRSPVGAVSLGFDLARGAYRNGKVPQATAPLWERVADSAIGTLGFAIFLGAAGAGNLTGDGPDDPNERKRLERLGWQPNSIKIGDKWVQYTNLGPVAVPMGMAGALGDSWRYAKDDADNGKKLGRAVQNLAQLPTEQSYMRGLFDLVTLIGGRGDPSETAERFGAQQVGSLVPFGAALNAVGAAKDPLEREVQGFGERLQKRIPVAREALPEKLDVYGQPEPGKTTGIEALTPIRFSQTNQKGTNNLDKMLGEIGINLSEPGDELRGVKLTREQKRQYQEVSGQLIREIVVPMAENLGPDTPPSVKEQLIRKYVDYARNIAAQQVVGPGQPTAMRRAERDQRLQGRSAPEDRQFGFTVP